MRNATPLAWLVVVSTLLLPVIARAGPIGSSTALPVHSGELILREQVIWMRSTRDPSPMDRHLDVLMASSVVIYGVDADLMVMGVLPFLYKRIELSTPTGRVMRHTSGFGDLMAVGRYTAFAVDRPGETFRVAPFLGIKAPTGAQNEADVLGRLPQPFQLGSGSWDPLGGAVLTWQTLRWELDASATYQARTSANHFRAGDEARGDVSFQYRLLPWGELGSGVPSFLFGVVEAAFVRDGMDRVRGALDHDSGGFTLYVAPGLQWISKRSLVEAAIQIPAVQRTNGLGLGSDFTAILSFRQSF